MNIVQPHSQETPEAPVPFGSTPTAPAGGGCSRVGLIGCGVVILLLGAAAIVFLVKAGDLFGWALTQFETEITRALPEDATDEDRQRLRQAFADAADAVREGEFDPMALQRLQSILRESLLDEDQSLTREQVLQLIEVLEEVGGRPPEPDPAAEEAPSATIAAVLRG